MKNRRLPETGQRKRNAKRTPAREMKRELPPVEERKPSRIPRVIDTIVRWGLVIAVFVLLAGGISARQTAIGNVEALEAELAEILNEKAALEQELIPFSDRSWREAYWKWRTMSHEPGEYYIDFVDAGS
jgi:hypothetical protein